ncbi:MAG: universal stress protein [Deltaproteobacteria bacterium]|jgi:nucleotide-binding universal stress UspA family protein|nr:universal stress protein [Deltaproteobacteria bacterium]
MKILVGYKDSKAAKDIMELAYQHGLAFKADVYIVTSLEQSPTLKKEEIDKAENILENLKKPFKASGIVCETQASVSYKSPGEDLVRFAEENDIDEIIIGIKKRSKVGKLVFGSTAQYVILKAPCPVLAVK